MGIGCDTGEGRHDREFSGAVAKNKGQLKPVSTGARIKVTVHGISLVHNVSGSHKSMYS